MYCEECQNLFDASGRRCPFCASKRTREPQDGDFCYFAETEALWGAVLADVFKQNAIRSYHKEVLGAGFTMRAGYHNERLRFYVEYAQREKAKALYDGLFSTEE